MEIENREIEQGNDRQEFPLPHFPPLPKIPSKAEFFDGKGRVREELVDLFVDYLCRENPIELKNLMDRIEKCVILKALRKAAGNQKEAARVLGLKYTTLNQKVKKHGIRFQRGVQLLES